MLIRKYSDSEIVGGIKTNNRKVLEYIYYKYYPEMEKYIVRNSGSRDEAMDVFQEAVYAAYKNICRSDFELNTDFVYYLGSICRNLWNKVLSAQKNNLLISKNIDELQDYPEPVYGKSGYKEMKRMDLFIEYLNKQTPLCKMVLELFFSKYPFKEIAQELNISEGHARKIKFDCIQKLHKEIRKDSRFKGLKNGEK